MFKFLKKVLSFFQFEIKVDAELFDPSFFVEISGEFLKNST